ncbi:hypothetical protein [Vibrio inusitatus]|nr:hypothetical protein [Vibrio inusitatus]
MRQHNLDCVVIRRRKEGWKIDASFTFVVKDKQDWKSAWSTLKKRLPRWRNCVSMSLSFEEVLSKSSVINASLSEEEIVNYVHEQLSNAILTEELAHDYRVRKLLNDEQKFDLYICKKETLTHHLKQCELSLDVVGWVLSDLRALSREIESAYGNRGDGFIEITEDGIIAASLNEPSQPMIFDIAGQSLAVFSESLTHNFLNLFADRDKKSITLLVYGGTDRVTELSNLLIHRPEFKLIDVSHTNMGQSLTSFMTGYPALACALGAYHWSKAYL